jgi:hypothetical protein
MVRTRVTDLDDRRSIMKVKLSQEDAMG